MSNYLRTHYPNHPSLRRHDDPTDAEVQEALAAATPVPEDERSIQAQTRAIRELREELEETCGVPGCIEPAERTCACCDGRRCSEHSAFSSEADEWFCALTDDGHRLWRTDLNYCDRREPISASGMSRWEVREEFDQREEERERRERERGER